MLTILFYVLIGITAGAISGLLGIGGAILIIPALIILCGFDQHLAQGTSLALMLPPIGLLAAMEYYRKGCLNVKAAIFICLAFFIGGYLGAKVAVSVPSNILRKAFSGLLVLIAIQMFFRK